MSRLLVACLLAALTGLSACAAPGPKGPYPPPESLKLAPLKRQEFVASFLQGRWCEAEDLLAMSVEDSLRRDEPCAAAYTVLTFWRLKAYLGLTDDGLRDQARRLRAMGLGCPGSEQLALLDETGIESAYPARDRQYRALLRSGDLDGLMALLGREQDALFASVYARKAARAALDAGQRDRARALLELARDVDGPRGWVVFLREDWRLLAETVDNSEDQKAIAERIATLDGLVIPCR